MNPRNRILRLGAVAVAGALAAAGLVAASVTTASADDPSLPPWQQTGTKDPNATATLNLFDASGNPVTTGSTTAPLGFGVSSAALRAGDTNATLFAYTPNAGKAPGAWSGTQLTATRATPLASPPGTVSGSLPAIKGDAADIRLADHIAAYPNASSATGYQGVYELRLRTSSVAKGVGSSYAVADVVVTGTTWTLYSAGSTKADTTTEANVPTTATYGAGFTVTAHVASGTGTPAGTATLKEGATTIGTAATLNGTGDATFNVSGTALGAGVHNLTVTYNGSASHNTSTSTAGQVTIAKAASSTVAAPPAKATYGTAYKVTATVSSTGSTPTGTATLKSGATTVGTVTLAAGKATFTVPGTKFAPGTRGFTVTYNGSANVNGSTSAQKNTVVGKAVARVTNVLNVKTIKHTKAAKLTVRVLATGVVATGKITIFDGTRALKTVTITAANKGTVVVVLPKLKKGSHKLKAVYLGSTLVNKGTGPVVTLKST